MMVRDLAVVQQQLGFRYETNGPGATVEPINRRKE